MEDIPLKEMATSLLNNGALHTEQGNPWYCQLWLEDWRHLLELQIPLSGDKNVSERLKLTEFISITLFIQSIHVAMGLILSCVIACQGYAQHSYFSTAWLPDSGLNLNKTLNSFEMRTLETFSQSLNSEQGLLSPSLCSSSVRVCDQQ